MLHLTEIKCVDYTGEWYGYFYVNARKPLRNIKDVDNNNFVPDGLRLVIDDQYYTPVSINGTLDPFTYIWRKYFKKHFHFGYRVNWEKESERK